MERRPRHHYFILVYPVSSKAAQCRVRVADSEYRPGGEGKVGIRKKSREAATVIYCPSSMLEFPTSQAAKCPIPPDPKASLFYCPTNSSTPPPEPYNTSSRPPGDAEAPHLALRGADHHPQVELSEERRWCCSEERLWGRGLCAAGLAAPRHSSAAAYRACSWRA